jgi:DNA polymerase elongation subunit (family B)
VLDIETEDLDPKLGRIICIGAKDVSSKETKVFHNKHEEVMLKDFLNYFCERGFREIIGYNILFDIRFLFAKCLKYKLNANGLFSCKFTDLMLIMKSVRKMFSYNKPGKLGEWTFYLFGEGKIELPDKIDELYRQGRIKEIAEYNEKDVDITYKLWKRIRSVLDDGVYL